MRKLSLPVAGGEAPARVDAARRQLGGRAQSDDGVGDLVGFADERGQARVGVVLFVAGDDLSVWTPTSGIVRPLHRSETAPADTVVPADLAAVAEAARRFARLAEGERVRYRDAGGEGEGVLVEKCRFGALIARSDGSIVAVGFARVGLADSN